MPLSPAPILPGTSPLPEPGKQPPNTRALRLGALVALPVLAAALVVGQVLLPSMLFLMPGLQAQAGASTPGQAGTAFQGFTFPWPRGSSGGGYTSPASFENMQSQAKTFHMNAVIIPVYADMPVANDSYIAWHNTDHNDVNTLPQAQYETAIKDARRAGLVPILELVVKQEDLLRDRSNTDGSLIGTVWSELGFGVSITTDTGQTTIGRLEKGWFDNYTAFAVHYAQLSEQYHLPYFIIGNGLTNVSYDTSGTKAKGDIDRTVPGDNCPASAAGRRDCEWRHIVNAIHSATYSSLQNHKQSQPGGGYTGKLIYAASWTGASDGYATSPEFESITWWDAVDLIGVDASFPITANEIDPQLSDMLNGWHGKGTNLGLSGSQADIYGRLEKVADKYNRPLIFTSAGYNSVAGANSKSYLNGNVTATEDQPEQLTDMQALLMTFTTASWWAGVFWVGDQPIPRDKQPNWIYSSNWAGTLLSTSKAAGQWLAQYYKPDPLPCSC